ncbi:hypothetical protein DITRI_Ditri16bG0117500 [Diplodiscus trichospermus]
MWSLRRMLTASSLELEAEGKAIVRSGWWRFHRNHTSNHCKWPGITCNHAGSVTHIFRPNYDDPSLDFRGKLDNINFSCLPNLVRLDITEWVLYGSIPAEIGSLSKLTFLDLSSNYLAGELPPSLGDLKLLENFDIHDNSFSGSIPSELGNLTNLVNLSIYRNHFFGPITSTLSQLTNLTFLDLSHNKLEGSIPPALAQLIYLKLLYLYYNLLSGPIPSALFALTNLQDTGLSSNQMNGSLSSEIGNLKRLEYLYLDGNRLSGEIPSEIGNLKRLEFLSLSDNRLSGNIPSQIGNLKRLKYLYLDGNRLSGEIPSEIGNLKRLESLYLGNNGLSGNIPSQIGNLKRLEDLSLQENRLSGNVPLQIGNLKNLIRLYIGTNNLTVTGSIPIEICKLESLEYLYLSHNRLTGPIPIEIGNCSQLAVLSLSYNNLNGTIPPQLGKMDSLKTIDLSHNFISGEIHSEMGKKLKYLDVALGCNNLTGTTAHSLDLSCSPTSLQSAVRSRGFSYLKLLPIFVFLAFPIIGFVYHCRLKYKNKKIDHEAAKNGDLFSIWNFDGKIAFEDIISATDDFDIKYCIGTGGYGSVYKAVLPSGKVVALKKLHRLEAEQPAFDKSFRNEVKVLTEIRHKNIVKLHGFCLHNRCMFLIYEYLEKGSLFCALRIDAEAMELDWSKRVNIIKSVAHALSYMHHDCNPPIVHRDISSNNILLNSESDAFVSDFGTARLLHPDSSNRTVIAGTYGFGVLALETLMGRHPGELLSTISSSSCAQNVMLNEVLDPRLSPPRNKKMVRDIAFVAMVAFACLRTTPKTRPTMKTVSQEFLHNKSPIVLPLHEISLMELKNHEMLMGGEIQSG